MNKFYPHLFEPLRIGRVTIKNRIFGSPITVERTVVDGVPTAECINAYETKARGGMGVVTVTESFVDFDRAARHEHGLDLVSPNMTVHHQESLYILTEAVRAHGALCSIQLNHAGNTNHPDTIKDRKNPIGPVGFVRPDGVTVEEMDEAMMSEVADNFANAAEAAKDFGFDMIMLHGGHGWLLGQFLSPLTNTRADAYGGSLENRARFPLLVLDRIRERLGPDFPIEYRVSGAERVPGGLEIGECAEFCRMIQDRVSLIHVTSGLYHNHVSSKAFSSMFHPHGCNLDLAEAIKKRVDIPVVAIGGFNDPQQMEDAIASGKCDACAIGRQQLADPFFAKKAQTGRADEIAPCCRCSCFNPLASDPGKRPTMRPFECTVNPSSCKELRLQYAPKPRGSRRVMVIGGGPAGMYAAITAAERGHSVTLYEKEPSLGGKLWFTDVDGHKESLRRFKDSLAVRCERLGVRLVLNTEATPELISREAPDSVICAIGADPIVPGIPGLRENAHHALYVYSDPDKIGRRVVMIGGGLIGVETGMWLAERGHEVQVIEMLDDWARDAYASHKEAIGVFMPESLKIRCSVQCTEVRPDGVTVKTRDGELVSYPADTVVYAIGMRPRAAAVDALRDVCPDFTEVGDCKKAGRVLEATASGMYAAMDIL